MMPGARDSAGVVPEGMGAAETSPDVYSVLLEDDRVRILEMKLPAGQSDSRSRPLGLPQVRTNRGRNPGQLSRQRLTGGRAQKTVDEGYSIYREAKSPSNSSLVWRFILDARFLPIRQSSRHDHNLVSTYQTIEQARS